MTTTGIGSECGQQCVETADEVVVCLCTYLCAVVPASRTSKCISSAQAQSERREAGEKLAAGVDDAWITPVSSAKHARVIRHLDPLTRSSLALLALMAIKTASGLGAV